MDPRYVIAKAFHEAYEELAPQFGYRTREASAKPWEEVPAQNKDLMVATVGKLLADGVITASPASFGRTVMQQHIAESAPVSLQRRPGESEDEFNHRKAQGEAQANAARKDDQAEHSPQEKATRVWGDS
jgi:hypothetical protein